MRYLIFAALLILYGCNSNGKRNTTSGRSIKHPILGMFKDIQFDTLKIYSGVGDTGKYAGVNIDSVSAYSFFPKALIAEHPYDPEGFYAISKFRCNSILWLLARTPSMYSSTSIKLFAFDETLDSIVSYTEMAEVWGDAGDEFFKTTWLYKRNRQLNAIVWELSRSNDELSDTISLRHDYYYQLKINKNGVDTLSKNQAHLMQQFRNLLEDNKI